MENNRTKKGKRAAAFSIICIIFKLLPLLLIPVISILSFHLESYSLEMLVLLLAIAISCFLCFGKAKGIVKRRVPIISILGFILAIIVLAMTAYPCINRYDVPEHACGNPGFHGKLLILAPHPDDELNLFAGAYETIMPDSEVYVLFSVCRETLRAEESYQGLSHFGIHADHLFSLGYCSSKWDDSTQIHLYNAPRNSPVSPDKTLSYQPFPCFRPGRALCQANFEDDLQAFIMEVRPDTIVSIDHDVHADHRALGLSSERVLANIMKEDPAYRPTVLKAFAYSGAYTQPPDFYSENLLSVQKISPGETMGEVNCYRWNERLRIPVGRSSLTRTLTGNLTARAFDEHASQKPVNPRVDERVCNGDQVFWWRPTDNVMMKAQVEADSGDAAQLNDFLLYDSNHVTDFEHMPYEHGWKPAGGKGTAKVSWPLPVVISEIHLFDQNDPANQIMHATIKLSNGKEIEVGELPAGGARVVVPTGCNEPITGFTLQIDDSTGEGSGIAEIEAYTQPPTPPFHVVKLQDSNGDFMYDYTTGSDGRLAFSIYTWGCEASGLTVEVKDASCSEVGMKEEGGQYQLNVPPGESCILEVHDSTGNILDAARIANPYQATRTIRKVLQSMDGMAGYLSWDSQRRYYTKLFNWVMQRLVH